MEDTDVRHEIETLMHEEDELWTRDVSLDDQARARLHALKVHLDQLWDLLRQRQARREFGEDPDAAEMRPEDVVERYVQ